MMRPPASGCLVCDEPLSRRGGARLVAWVGGEISVRTINEGAQLPGPGGTRRVDRLQGDFIQIIIVSSGMCMQAHLVERARKIVEAKERPWVCQQCASYALCPVCREPLSWAPGVDHMDEAGRVWHTPILAPPHCTNPDCPSSR